jgi:Gpi18-like mannosyltransferase
VNAGIIGDKFGRWRAGLDCETWVKPLSIAFGTRAAVYILTLFFTGLLIGDPATKPNFWQALTRWDGEWYLRIAQDGYQWSGPATQSAVAFFPLYPLLGRIVGLVFGDARWGLFIVANVSFVFFLYYLYRLGLVDFDEPTAARAIIFAAIFPGAFVLAAFYAEATAFAVAVAAFYYARAGRWRWAIALGFLSALARLPGVIIVVPLAFEYFRQRGLRPQILTLGIVPLGLVAFGAYVWALSGNPWTVLTIQSTAWFRNFTLPWDTLKLALDRASWARENYVVAVALLDVGTIGLFIMLTLWAVFRMPPAYWLYALPILVGAISQTADPDKTLPTAAITRYLMAIFPGYIALGQIARNPFLDQLVRWTFAVLMSGFAIYFFSGYWVL